MYSPFRVDTACVTLVPVPAGSELKNSPKQEPETIAIKQINRIISTATQPPAAMAVINPFTAAMVALTAAAVALTATFAPVDADFAVAFAAAFAVCWAVFAVRWAVLIPLVLYFTLFMERLAVFTAF